MLNHTVWQWTWLTFFIKELSRIEKALECSLQLYYSQKCYTALWYGTAM